MCMIREQVHDSEIAPGSVSVTWLGQAGFIFKASNGTVIMSDPYLSDSVERICGFKRLMPKLLGLDEIVPDILLCTHHHEDHLDADAVPALMRGGSAQFVCSETAGCVAEKIGVDSKRVVKMRRGEMVTVRGVTIHAMFADHGDMAPDALGFYLELPGISIYVTGDTGYAPEKFFQLCPPSQTSSFPRSMEPMATSTRLKRPDLLPTWLLGQSYRAISGCSPNMAGIRGYLRAP